MDPGFTADGLDDLLNPIYGASQPIWPGPIRMEVSMTSPEQCKYTNRGLWPMLGLSILVNMFLVATGSAQQDGLSTTK